MARKIKEYKVIEAEDHSDLVAEPQYELFFNNGGERETGNGDTKGIVPVLWLWRHGYCFFFIMILLWSQH